MLAQVCAAVLYLALQERRFRSLYQRPQTRSGVPKGMWQFTPQTSGEVWAASGPLVDLQRLTRAMIATHPDRSTRAAAKYLKDSTA